VSTCFQAALYRLCEWSHPRGAVLCTAVHSRVCYIASVSWHCTVFATMGPLSALLGAVSYARVPVPVLLCMQVCVGDAEVEKSM
jgi:hypothetical protein